MTKSKKVTKLLNPIEIIPGEVYIKKYEDTKFANWRIEILGRGESMVFNNLFDALIYLGILMQGMEINSAHHLMRFIQDIIPQHNNKKIPGCYSSINIDDLKRYENLALRKGEK